LKECITALTNYLVKEVADRDLVDFRIFSSTFQTTKLLFPGLHPDMVMFSGNSLSEKKLYLLYDRDSGHYNIITNLKGAMAKKYIYITM
jgi:hypothetical protein